MSVAALTGFWLSGILTSLPVYGILYALFMKPIKVNGDDIQLAAHMKRLNQLVTASHFMYGAIWIWAFAATVAALQLSLDAVTLMSLIFEIVAGGFLVASIWMQYRAEKDTLY